MVGLRWACAGSGKPGTRINGQNPGVWDVGGGFNIPLPRTNVKLCVEAYYTGLTNNTHTTFVPMTLGIRW
jgi:hypothetical protein